MPLQEPSQEQERAAAGEAAGRRSAPAGGRAVEPQTSAVFLSRKQFRWIGQLPTQGQGAAPHPLQFHKRKSNQRSTRRAHEQEWHEPAFSLVTADGCNGPLGAGVGPGEFKVALKASASSGPRVSRATRVSAQRGV